MLSLVSNYINRLKANSVKSASTSVAASARMTTNQTMEAADSTGDQNLLLVIYITSLPCSTAHSYRVVTNMTLTHV